MSSFIGKFNFFILLFIFSHLEYVQSDSENITEDVVEQLYLKYKEAANDRNKMSFRRLLKNNRQYEVHVEKLKEVNGFKIHNLIIKESLRSDSSPLVYISNPVESKIPKAFLTLEEFKHVLTDRVLRQRNLLNKENLNTTVINKSILKTTFRKKISKVTTLNSFKNEKEGGKNRDFTQHLPRNLRDTDNRTFLIKKINFSKTAITKNKIYEVATSPSITDVTERSANSVIQGNDVILLTKKLLYELTTSKYTPFANINPTIVAAAENVRDNNNNRNWSNASLVTVAITRNITLKVGTGSYLIDLNLRNKTQSMNFTKSNSVLGGTKSIETQVVENKTLEDQLENIRTSMASINITDKNFAKNKEFDFVTNTIMKESQDLNKDLKIGTKKVRPSRKTTKKFFQESNTVENIKQKRTTLGRPLVFMGN